MAAPEVTTYTLSSGWEAVRLRNDALEVTLLPHKGAEIYSLVARQYGPSGIDLLWKSPWGLRPPPVSSTSGPESQSVWLDYYSGGWQELLPNAGGACTVNGAAHSFHGEASVVPWSYAIERPAGAAPRIRFTVRLARTPLHIEKLVSLDPDRPILHLWERVTSHGATPQPIMWGHHPAFGAPFLAAGCRLDVPAKTFLANAPQVSPNTWIAAGERSVWPHVMRARGARGAGGAGGTEGPGRAGATGGPNSTVDLSLIPGPDSRTNNFGYLLDLDAGWYALSNHALGLGFALTWPLDVFPCLWLWQELCGTQEYPWYGATYVMGVEPHTSPTAAGLATAIEHGTARTLQPGESLEATLTATLFTPRGKVTHATPDGTVQFA